MYDSRLICCQVTKEMLMRRFAVLLFFAAAMAPALGSQATRQTKDIDDAAAQLVQLNASQARMMDTNKKMAEIHSALNEKVAGVCKVGNNKVSPADAAKALSELCGVSMSYNTQYLALQTQMQNENRQYTTISNVMKTKHDTVKNSISNVR